MHETFIFDWIVLRVPEGLQGFKKQYIFRAPRKQIDCFSNLA